MALYETLIYFLSNHNKGRSDGQMLMNFQKNSATTLLCLVLVRSFFEVVTTRPAQLRLKIMRSFGVWFHIFEPFSYFEYVCSVNGYRPPVILVSYFVFGFS